MASRLRASSSASLLTWIFRRRTTLARPVLEAGIHGSVRGCIMTYQALACSNNQKVRWLCMRASQSLESSSSSPGNGPKELFVRTDIRPRKSRLKKYSNVVAASALTKREGLAKVCVLSCNSSKTLTLNYETNFLIKIGIFSFLIFWLPKKK